MKSRTPTPFPARPTTPTDAQAIGALATGVATTMREAFTPPPVLTRPSYNAGLSRTHHRRGMPSMGGMR